MPPTGQTTPFFFPIFFYTCDLNLQPRTSLKVYGPLRLLKDMHLILRVQCLHLSINARLVQQTPQPQLTHLSAFTGGFCRVMSPTERETRENWAMEPVGKTLRVSAAETGLCSFTCPSRGTQPYTHFSTHNNAPVSSLTRTAGWADWDTRRITALVWSGAENQLSYCFHCCEHLESLGCKYLQIIQYIHGIWPL